MAVDSNDSNTRGIKDVYIKFNLDELDGTSYMETYAYLKLRVGKVTEDATLSIYKVTGSLWDEWSESTLTYNGIESYTGSSSYELLTTYDVVEADEDSYIDIPIPTANLGWDLGLVTGSITFSIQLDSSNNGDNTWVGFKSSNANAESYHPILYFQKDECTSDLDSDNDGILDCFDVCPDDPLKTTDEGYCGCGNVEYTSEGDIVSVCDGNCCAGTNACDYMSGSSITMCAGACNGDDSCRNFGEVREGIFIGLNSCSGYDACDSLMISGDSVDAVTIGNNSCMGDNSCVEFDTTYGIIGDNSCNGEQSCMNLENDEHIVGDNACNGAMSCSDGSAIYEDDTCNDDYEC